MGIHKFGFTTEQGVRLQTFGTFNDVTFDRLTVRGLPNGWFCWHLEDNEIAENSTRVQLISEVPMAYLIYATSDYLEAHERASRLGYWPDGCRCMACELTGRLQFASNGVAQERG